MLNGPQVSIWSAVSPHGGSGSSGPSNSEASGFWHGSYNLTGVGNQRAGSHGDWAGSYNLTAVGVGNFDAIITVRSATPFLEAWKFVAATPAWGIKLSNPSSLPADGAHAICKNAAKNVVVIRHGTTPFVEAYRWSNTAGFGTKYSNPGTLPQALAGGSSDCSAVHINGTDTEILVTGAQSDPVHEAYAWTNASGFGTKRSNMSSPGTWSGGSQFSGTNAHIVGGRVGPLGGRNYSSGFGSALTDSSTLGGGINACTSVRFAPSNNHVAVSGDTSPYIYVFPWTGVFGTKLADPGTLPTGLGRCVAWNNNSTEIAITHNSTPFVTAYPITTTFGTKRSDPGTAIPTVPRGCTFSVAGSAIIIGHGNSPFVTMYAYSSGFGSKATNPATLPGNVIQGVIHMPV